jgi:hypothetical protein
MALLAGFVSPGSAQKEPTTGAAKAPARNKQGMGRMRDTCPMKVPGTTVTSADVEGGVALAFITKTGDVAELRRRVQRAAETHNSNYAGGGMMMGGQGRDGADTMRGRGAGAEPGHMGGDRGGMMMGGGAMTGGGMMIPASTVSAENVNGGARLVFRPKDTAQMEALREHVRMRAERMTQGECPMMSTGAQGQAAPPSGAGDTGHEAQHKSPPTKAAQPPAKAK